MPAVTFTRHAVCLQSQSPGTAAGVAATGVGAEPARVAIVLCVCLAFVDIYIAVYVCYSQRVNSTNAFLVFCFAKLLRCRDVLK